MRIFLFIVFLFFLITEVKSQFNESDLINQLKENYLGGSKNRSSKKLSDKTLSQEDSRYEPDDSLIYNNLIKKDTIAPKKIYGAELYLNKSLNFFPQKNIPTPENYILGIGDEVNINIFGIQEYFTKQLINNSGYIDIENYGPIQINGLTIKQAEAKIKYLLSKSLYSHLKNGESKLILTLEKIKTINVTLIGAKRSGNYNISSLSTLFHVLFLGGGPDSVNTYRLVKLYRKNELYKIIDLYEFLNSGNSKDNINLQNGDVILIPSILARVKIDGEVRRNAIYDLRDTTEKMSEVLKFVGGFTANAIMNNVKIQRTINQKKIIQNIDSSSFTKFYLKDGDSITFRNIDQKLHDYVDISGQVFSPGRYDLIKNYDFKTLLSNAGGLLDDSYKFKANIWRYDSNMLKYPISVDLTKSDLKNLSLKLKQYDSVVVYKYLDLNDNRFVSINGEVRKPGKYNFQEGLKLSDIILLSGNIKDSGNKYDVEVLRKKLVIDKFNKSQEYFEKFSIKIDSNFLMTRDNDFNLNHNDIINVKIDPNIFEIKNVKINGDVLYPGIYTLLNNQEKLSSVIKRSGNIIASGDVTAARVYRKVNEKELQSDIDKQIKEYQRLFKVDTSLINKKIIIDTLPKMKLVYVDLETSLKRNNYFGDLILENGDSVYIPSYTNTISIEGEVFNKGIFIYNYKKGMNYYINSASGFTKNADRKRLYVIQPNGKGRRTKSFLGIFRIYPRVLNGSRIIIPSKFDSESNLLNRVTQGGFNFVATQAGNLTNSFLNYFLYKNLLK